MVQRKGKSELERKVYEDVVSFSRAQGGEGRRNADRLEGFYGRYNDRPDVVIEASNGTVIGLEHFRVDDQICHDKHAQSRSAQLSSRFESERNRIICDSEKANDLQSMVRALQPVVSEALKNDLNACVRDLVISLEKRINDVDSGHASRLGDYRGNLKKWYGADAPIEIGYLIEFHTGFQGLTLNDQRGSRALDPGEMPLFSRVYDLLAEAAKQVDWILLGFYTPFGNELKSGAIVKCSNGCFKTSAARQGLQRTEYAGSENIDLLGYRKSIGAKFAASEDEIELLVENPFTALGGNAVLDDAMRGAVKALNCHRRKLPFVATATVQMLFELMRNYVNAHKGDFEATDMIKLLRRITPDQFYAWVRLFESRP